ncbi:MAG: NUDIX domain-containing protein [Erysipelotrichaceae bacterium]|nr:NUDIX domain-containing protein [Erysipelotrichaceae bacterium]
MSERFKSLSAVMLLLTRNNGNNEEILFQKRRNTGYCDGFYDLSASGHVDANESMKHAMCREAKEELGIEINEEDLEFVCLIHKNSNGCIYYNGYFKANKWNGEPVINEPQKNEELKWINIVNDRVIAIQNYKNNIKYSEYGW